MIDCIPIQKPHKLKMAPAERAGCLAAMAIARALAGEPRVILADEPKGNLDTTRIQEIMDLLCQLRRDRGLTITMVTHEEDLAAYVDRLIWMVDSKVKHDRMNGKVGRVQLRSHRHTGGQGRIVLRL